jgi:hypothetical protein
MLGKTRKLEISIKDNEPLINKINEFLLSLNEYELKNINYSDSYHVHWDETTIEKP